MPDWSYQPLLRPLLFRLSAEHARRTTIGLLAAQARLPGGPALFRTVAQGRPPPAVRTRFLGMQLASGVGIGAGIDVDGAAAVLLQELGVGFVEIGPLGLDAVRRRTATDPRRLTPVHGLALSAAHPRTARGLRMLAVVAAALVLSGIAYLVLAATVQLLPDDTDHLRMSVAALCRLDDCRVVHFIAHDRAAYGGVVTAIGVLYAWLVAGPLRRGEGWAWWALALSGVAGYVGFLSFVGYGYLDTWHAAATLALIALWAPGLVLTRGAIAGCGGIRATLRRPGAQAWLWSPAGRGRLGVLLLAGGMLSAGLTILVVAITTVFVPQDTAFLELDRHRLDAIDPRLVAVIAHDRAEFGAGLFALGILFGLGAWKGIRPGAHGAGRAFAAAGAALFIPAYVAHPAIGYTSFAHLAPVYAGAALLLTTLSVLRGALRRPVADPAVFPDV